MLTLVTDRSQFYHVKTTQFPSVRSLNTAAASHLWFAVSLKRVFEVRGGCCGVAAVAMVLVLDDAGNDIYKQLAACMGRSQSYSPNTTTTTHFLIWPTVWGGWDGSPLVHQ